VGSSGIRRERDEECGRGVGACRWLFVTLSTRVRIRNAISGDIIMINAGWVAC